MKGESSQKQVKIDIKLYDEINEWLKTPEAKSLGFNSMARYATITLGHDLQKRKQKRIQIVNFQDNTISLTDNELPEFDILIEVFLEKKNLVCDRCKSSNCIHVVACLENDMIKKQLKSRGLKII